MTESKPEYKPRRKAGRPRVPGAFRNPFPLRLNDEQLAHCQKMAVIHGHVNAYIRHLIDNDMS